MAVSLNLRLGIVMVGPVIEEVRRDLGVGRAAAGFLWAIPFLCLGLAALPAGNLVGRVSVRRLVAGGLVLIGAGTVLRAAAPGVLLFATATLVLGAGIAAANVAVPVIVKQRFAGSPGRVTGLGLAGQAMGGALGAITVAPLTRALGSWRAAFALSVIPVVVALPLWLRRAPREAPLAKGRVGAPPPGSLPVAAVFGLQAMCFTAMMAWIAAVYRDAGWSVTEAGFATGAISLLTIATSLMVPAWSDRGDRRRWLAGASIVMSAGIVGAALAPQTIGWMWLLLFGIGNGATFPLALTLPVDVGRSASEVRSLGAWMFALGSIPAAVSPGLVGALRDSSHGFRLPLMFLAGAGALVAVLVWLVPARAPQL